jgi:hypothetical protein
MSHLVRILAALTFIAACSRAASNQIVARYAPIGASGSASVLVTDGAGNIFVVANVTEVSGRPQIRAIKMDPQGNVLASYDFGGSSRSFPDAPSGAVVDPTGNLIVVGTTASSDFPLVSPVIAPTSTQAGFVVKLDAQLSKILFQPGSAGARGRARVMEAHPSMRSLWMPPGTSSSPAAPRRATSPPRPAHFRLRAQPAALVRPSSLFSLK